MSINDEPNSGDKINQDNKSLVAAAQWIYGSIKSENSLLDPTETREDDGLQPHLSRISEGQELRNTETTEDRKYDHDSRMAAESIAFKIDMD